MARPAPHRAGGGQDRRRGPAGRRVTGHGVPGPQRLRGRVRRAGEPGCGRPPRELGYTPSGAGPGPAPAAHPGVGGDRRRHREPLLHGHGPGHGGRGPGRGPPTGAGQLRRGPREGGRLPRHRRGRADGRRRHRRGVGPGLAASTCSSSGASPWWPSTGAPSATRTTSTPSSSTTSWAPARPPSTSLAAGATRIACITGPDPGRARPASAWPATSRRCATTASSADADLVRRADFKEDGGYAATRTLLGAPQATRRAVRRQQPHDARRAAGRSARPACASPTTCCSSASTTPRGPRSSRRSSPSWPSPPTRSAARPARLAGHRQPGAPGPPRRPRRPPLLTSAPAASDRRQPTWPWCHDPVSGVRAVAVRGSRLWPQGLLGGRLRCLVPLRWIVASSVPR